MKHGSSAMHLVIIKDIPIGLTSMELKGPQERRPRRYFKHVSNLREILQKRVVRASSRKFSITI